MKNEYNANRFLASASKRRKELLAERKPLSFSNKTAKVGDKNNSKTWQLV